MTVGQSCGAFLHLGTGARDANIHNMDVIFFPQRKNMDVFWAALKWDQFFLRLGPLLELDLGSSDAKNGFFAVALL